MIRGRRPASEGVALEVEGADCVGEADADDSAVQRGDREREIASDRDAGRLDDHVGAVTVGQLHRAVVALLGDGVTQAVAPC